MRAPSCHEAPVRQTDGMRYAVCCATRGYSWARRQGLRGAGQLGCSRKMRTGRIWGKGGVPLNGEIFFEFVQLCPEMECSQPFCNSFGFVLLLLSYIFLSSQLSRPTRSVTKLQLNVDGGFQLSFVERVQQINPTLRSCLPLYNEHPLRRAPKQMMCQVNQTLEGVSERLSRFFSFSSKISQGREEEEKSE